MDSLHPASTTFSIGWLSYGPELAIGLFLAFIVYTLALLATTYRRRLPGLNWLSGHSLIQDLSIALALLALIPATALSLLLAAGSANHRVQRVSVALQAEVTALADTMDEYFARHRNGIASLATSVGRAGRFDPASVGEWLEGHHAIYHDYLTMLAANSFGDIVSATTLVQGRPQHIAGLTHNVSDRQYFRQPMSGGGVYVSDVFQGRGLGRDPIVAVSAAVRAPSGLTWGIVEGSLNLEKLSEFRAAQRLADLDAALLILDSKQRVLYASDTEQYSILEPLPVNLGQSLLRQTDHPDGRPLRQDPHNSMLVATRSTEMDWLIVATTPLQPIYGAVLAEYRVTLLWMLVTVIAAALLSITIARRVRRPLSALTEAVRSLDLDGSEADIQAPPHAPIEIKALFHHLATVSDRLHSSYRQLLAVSEAGKHYRDQLELSLARRDAEVRNRTRELEQTNDKLRKLSTVDELTGLANRRHFHETMDRAWRHGLREQTPVSVIIIDIDHFKAFNDTYGHQAGDQCLSRVASAMSGVVGRSLDLIARCGGEEFMIVLGNTDLHGALQLAERVRQLVEDLAIPHRGSSTDAIVTVSVGVASVTPQRGDDYDELIHRADQALYLAKNEGRNSVGGFTDGAASLFRPNNVFDFNDQVDLRDLALE